MTIDVFTHEAAAPLRRLIPGIAYQRLERPEQQHQEDAQHAHHREYRLVEDELDDVPEPGRRSLDHGAERLLAGLMDVVPELAEPGEPQVLVGDPACPVIDHENEPASQQQQPYQTKKPADHASPCYLFALRR